MVANQEANTEQSTEKLGQLNPDHSFDPSHLKDTAQGTDSMGMGSGVELAQEPEQEMEM